MRFEIGFTQTASEHVRAFRKVDQTVIFDAIAKQLRYDAATETRNRKRLSENELADWELRVDEFRVFYDLIDEGGGQSVKIKAVGQKVHNKLFVGGKEVKL